MSMEPRAEARLMPPSTHGGLDVAELRRHGLRPDDVLDFSASTNPYGPSILVREAVAGACLDAYPDRDAVELREALARYLGVSPNEILAGNGASELIWLVALAFLRPGDTALVLGPTYGEYARVSTLMGATVTTCASEEADGFIPDAQKVGFALARLQPKAAFFCNPNNPTGCTLSSDKILFWAREHRKTLFVVDEAYLAFARATPSADFSREENIVLVRSMTKDFGLAGLRLGYAVARADTIAWLKRVQPPWSVSAVAQAAGLAALRDPDHLSRSLNLLAQATTDLRSGLADLGLAPLPSATHFFLLRVGDGAAFRSALLKHGIVVRDCASFGLPAHVRIAARRPEENRRLLEAVEQVLRADKFPDRKARAPMGRARNGTRSAGRAT